MDGAREWLKNNHDTVLDTYNKMIFKAEWDKYAKGTVSAWKWIVYVSIMGSMS